jgi:hypothetical protein
MAQSEKHSGLWAMHNIEPYYRWEPFYQSSEDPQSPFYGKEYNYDLYTENIYGYYIAPGWDFFGSETLYLKILYVDYDIGYGIIELIGEWNDALNNDIMHLKRNVLEIMMRAGTSKFILLGENVLNFHGSDDCYYEEWFEETEEEGGWIAAINFREFVMDEWRNYNIDSYINFGGTLQLSKWRVLEPAVFFEMVRRLIERRIALI